MMQTRGSTGTRTIVSVLVLLATITGCESRTVTAVDVASLQVSPHEFSLAPGETLRLTAAAVDAGGDALQGREVAWSSDDEAIATVDAEGLVRAHAVGSTTIRARAGEAEGSAVLTVAEAARIGLSDSDVTFQAEAGSNAAPREILVSSEGAGPLRDLAVEISYEGQASGWLTAALGSIETPSTLTLRASAGNLGGGTYRADVRIVSPSAGNSPRVVRVTFHVGSAPPSIRLATSAAGFSWEPGRSAPPPQTIGITGEGGTLSGLQASIRYGSGPQGWLEASLNRTSTPADLTLRVTPSELSTGTYEATVRIEASGAAGSADIRVRLGVGESMAEISLERANVGFTATEGDDTPAPVSVRVTNSGEGHLAQLASSVSYESGSTGWLSASLSDTSAPTDLVLRVDHDGIGTGEHRARVDVASPDALNSPQSLTVRLNVLPAEDEATVKVSRVRYTPTGGDDRHLDVTIFVEDQDGQPVSGASIEAEMRNVDRDQTWTDSGSTASDGSVRFRINHHPSGCYRTTVSTVSASNLEWDGVTPTNEYCKDPGSFDLEAGLCNLVDATLDGDLDVPDGVTCTLTNVTIRGDLNLGTGSSLDGESLHIDGNLEGDGAGDVALSDSFVDGNIQLEGGGNADLRANTVEGNVELDENRGSLTATSNHIDGNLQAFDNLEGPFTFSDNTIGGNLQCGGNDPAPGGSGNSVEGDAEGQCSGM